MTPQRIKLILMSSIILVLFLAGVVFLFIGGDMMAVKELTQTRVHGTITNHTSHPIRITEYRFVRELPPGVSSKRIGVNDADSLVIDRPTKMNDTVYESGVFKFCDLAHVTVQEQNGRDVVSLNLAGNLCKLMNDYKHFSSIPEAFPIRHHHF